jgi:DEAD/DEAH box helicase domain-containing protein
LVFSAQDRRKIEAEAFSGNLLGIVATNALELGVDIGSLDAVLVHGFPPTVASFVRVLSFFLGSFNTQLTQYM